MCGVFRPGKGGLALAGGAGRGLLAAAGKLGKVSPAGHGPLWEEDDDGWTEPAHDGKGGARAVGRKRSLF